jgi:hypothetical protein
MLFTVVFDMLIRKYVTETERSTPYWLYIEYSRYVLISIASYLGNTETRKLLQHKKSNQNWFIIKDQRH